MTDDDGSGLRAALQCALQLCGGDPDRLMAACALPVNLPLLFAPHPRANAAPLFFFSSFRCIVVSLVPAGKEFAAGLPPSPAPSARSTALPSAALSSLHHARLQLQSMRSDITRMLLITRSQVAAMQKSFQIAVDAAKTIRRTCVSANVTPPSHYCFPVLSPPPPPALSPLCTPTPHGSLQEQPLLPPTCQAVDYCQWPLESTPPDRLKWRQQQHARVPPLPTVFAPPGFLIERISLKPVGYGKTLRSLCRRCNSFVQWNPCL